MKLSVMRAKTFKVAAGGRTSRTSSTSPMHRKLTMNIGACLYIILSWRCTAFMGTSCCRTYLSGSNRRKGLLRGSASPRCILGLKRSM